MAADKPQNSSTADKPRSAADEIAILQQILLLRGGQLENFAPIHPPPAIRRLLRRATLPQLQGALVEVLAAMRAAETP